MAGGLEAQLPRRGGVQQPGGQHARVDDVHRAVGHALVVERRGAEAAPPVRLVGDGDGLGEHLLAELASSGTTRRAPPTARRSRPSSGPSVEAAMRFSKITGAVVEAILREPSRATARRPASAPICSADGRSARQRVWRPSPARSIAEPSPAMAPAEMPKLEARCRPVKPALVASRQAAGRPVGRAGIGVGDAGRRRARRSRPPAPAPPATRRQARRRRRDRGRAAARAPADPRARGRRRGPPAPAAPSPRPARSAWRGRRPRCRSPTPTAWRRPTKTRTPRSRLSSRSTSSSAPSRTVTDSDWRSANTASAASAPAARALATTSCSRFSSMPRIWPMGRRATSRRAVMNRDEVAAGKQSPRAPGLGMRNIHRSRRWYVSADRNGWRFTASGTRERDRCWPR